MDKQELIELIRAVPDARELWIWHGICFKRSLGQASCSWAGGVVAARSEEEATGMALKKWRAHRPSHENHDVVVGKLAGALPNFTDGGGQK